jgi:hypothetical protein
VDALSWKCFATGSPEAREVKRSAVLPSTLHSTMRIQECSWLSSIEQPLSPEAPPFPLSSRPKRTRISYFVIVARTAGAVSRKGNRMKVINATELDRKSGERSGEISVWMLFPENVS